MNQDQESVESLAVSQVKNRLQEMVEEIVNTILEPTLAVKLYLDQTNFATCQKWLSDQTIQLKILNGKYEMQLSLELFKLPLQTSDTLEESGKRTHLRKHF